MDARLPSDPSDSLFSNTNNNTEMMIDAAAFISDNLKHLHHLEKQEHVAKLELLIYALRDFHAHEEEDRNNLDSRRAILLDSARSIFNVFYVEHLEETDKPDIREAARFLYLILDDYIMKAHQIMFDAAKNKFTQHRYQELDEVPVVEDAEKNIDLKLVKDLVAEANAALDEMYEVECKAQPANVKQLKDRQKSDKSVLHVVNYMIHLLEKHKNQDTHDLIQERMVQIPNAGYLLQALHQDRFQNTPYQSIGEDLLELMMVYSQKADDLNTYITFASDKSSLDAFFDFSNEPAAARELNTSSSGSDYDSSDLGGYEEINEDGIVWHNVPRELRLNPSPDPYDGDSERSSPDRVPLLTDVDDEDSSEEEASPPLSTKERQRRLADNFFQPRPVNRTPTLAIPILQKDPDEVTLEDIVTFSDEDSPLVRRRN